MSEIIAGQRLVIIQKDGVDAAITLSVVVKHRVCITVTIGVKPPEPDGFAPTYINLVTLPSMTGEISDPVSRSSVAAVSET